MSALKSNWWYVNIGSGNGLATSHYLSQCWPRSMLPYGITKPQYVLIDTLPWYVHLRYVTLAIPNMIYFSKRCQCKVAGTHPTHPHPMNYSIGKVFKFRSKAWKSLQCCLILIDILTNQLAKIWETKSNSKGGFISMISSTSSEWHILSILLSILKHFTILVM